MLKIAGREVVQWRPPAVALYLSACSAVNALAVRPNVDTDAWLCGVFLLLRCIHL